MNLETDSLGQRWSASGLPALCAENMKLKQILIGLVLLGAAGAGVWLLLKPQSAAPASDDEQAPQTMVTVQTGTLQRMTLHQYLNGYGTITPMPATATAPAADAPLASPVAGVVAKINMAEGQQVQKGDLLVELNSGGLTLSYAREELERQKKLYAEHNTALRTLQNAEAQLALLQVIAPLSGTVAHVNARPGAAVDLNTVLAEVIDLSRLSLRAEVPVSDAADLKTGQEVEVLSQPAVHTQLTYVSPTVETNNGTILARALLPADSGLHPGQFVGFRIVTGVHTNCLAAPAESVVTDIDGQSVIGVVLGKEATQIPVETGFRENGWVEIKGQDLKEGDAVVTVGAYGLPKKTPVQVVNSTTTAAETNSTPAK